jgi:ABC-type branched-subunit amino acid transport system ATPase component
VSALLEVCHLRVVYGERVAVRDVSVTLGHGEAVGLVPCQATLALSMTRRRRLSWALRFRQAM